MNGHCQLVQDPLGYVQPVQVVVKQLCRSTFILAGVGLFVCLFAWGLTALSAQIGYIAP